ncbi:protein trichome birefringence-like 13 isoform X3 [Amaranthus tricolor]|uniref:protein trichome birefringence-like 13 isoform X3 n=1 Tax=Amaranthus tricolor TaxID=29722 RepID=UPI002584DB06|nr:protein trichome birefringence-like 13 isoform X3 [Amaranthus tricolor]
MVCKSEESHLRHQFCRWWAPSKFNPVMSSMLLFKKGTPIMPPIAPDVGLDKVLRQMILYVESKMRPGSIRIFRTQSPRHFEGGDWDQGGFCPRLKPLVSQEEIQGFVGIHSQISA